MYNKDMGKVKYLLQTHTHLDHFDINHFTTLDFKYETKLSHKLNLICSDLCLSDIQSKVTQFDKMDLYNQDYLDKIGLSIQTVNHGNSLSIEDYSIKAIHCNHDEKIGAQLYLIKQNNKSVLYATDTPQITETALKELNGEKIDCIFLDESFGVRNYMFSHLNIEGFDLYIKTLKNNNLLRDDCLVYATHLTHDGNPLHDELEQILNKYGYHVAYDGMEFDL
jgi:phosphoribosyl 1,2-cyclic phosphate phosphodiesterase